MSIAVNAGPARGANLATPLVGTPILQAPPTPADKPRDFGAPPPASRFAELLKRNRAEAPKPAPTMPAKVPGSNSNDGVDTAETSAIEAKAAPANAEKARASTAKATAKPTAGDDEQRGDDRNVASDDRRDLGDDSERSERSAAPLMPGDRLDSRPMGPGALDGLNRPASGDSSAND